MAGRDEIVSFCDELLEIELFDDYGPNGLQVPGDAKVDRITTGVTASLAFLERSVDSGAQLALAHHGLFFGDGSRALSERLAARLRVALSARLSVAAYHLPLDAHARVGNNALLCEALELEPQRQFGEVKGRPIGLVAKSRAELGVEELIARIGTLLGREPLVFAAGPARIGKLGIVSGAGSGALEEAAGLGLDALITGEPAEHAMADANEVGIHFIAAGHYATETFGIRRLGELVAERFEVAHEFIDVPNPV